MKTATTLLALSCLLAICGETAQADGESEFLVFLSADNLERFSVMDAALQEGDFTPTIDLLYSYNNGPWRALAEYFLTDDEAELERMQFGYEYSTDSTFWFGRYHQPVSAWNYRYHHGAYLQPSISPPSIENWEDDGGVIPAHITGFLVDTMQPLGASNGLRYVASFGFAPIISGDELLPFDILDPDEGGSRPAGTLNISYYPDVVGASSIGLILGYAEIEAPPSTALGNVSTLEIRQEILGAQAAYESERWNLLVATYLVSHKSHGSIVEVEDDFAAGYLQVQGNLSANTSAYGRIERTHNSDADYLQLFSNYVYKRDLIGFRWDFANRQALTIELSNNSVLTDQFSEIRLQWSSALPK